LSIVIEVELDAVVLHYFNLNLGLDSVGSCAFKSIETWKHSRL